MRKNLNIDRSSAKLHNGAPSIVNVNNKQMNRWDDFKAIKKSTSIKTTLPF